MKEDHWTLIKKNVTNPVVFKQIESGFIKRNRVTAVVLGSFLIVALIAVVYGFVQTTKSQEAYKEIKRLEVRVSEVEKLSAIATESKIIAEEAAKVAYEELEECRNKK